MREKLIEFIEQGYNKYSNPNIKGDFFAVIADHLIANGVTFAEDNNVPSKWIPVTERLPEGMDWVACACKDGEIRILCYDYIMDDWDIHDRPNTCYAKGFVTHWMPLPEPPKGE